MLELMVIISIIGVMAALMLPTSFRAVSDSGLRSSASMTVDALRLAQSNVMSGRGNHAWGVHFQGDRAVIFRGTTYDPNGAENETTLYNLGAQLASVTLTPGGACILPAGTGNCDFLFPASNGVPSVYGTVVLTDGTAATATVEVNAVGMTEFR